MKILGIHGGNLFLDESNPVGWAYHDSAAVLIEDGAVLAAIEEERLTRMKHCNCFPANAIRFCLESTGTSWREIDAIATNASSQGLEISDTMAYLGDPGRTLRPGARTRIAALIEKAFGVEVAERILFCNHHLAHAWSAFIPSGFERALVVSLDGDGDNLSGMVLTAAGSELTPLKEFGVDQSLGNLYTSLISLLGYTRFDEYKVMGLAPYGDPRVFGPALAECYTLLADGDYRLDALPAWLGALNQAGLIGQARRKGQPFVQTHSDLAAAIQQMLETIAVHILRSYREVTGETKLCLAGGVAHNCTMNGIVLRSGLFERVFVQPAAHDAGGALGAAWCAYYTRNPLASRPNMSHLYYGTDLPADEKLSQELERWAGLVSFRKSPDIAAECAELLSQGAVVAWVQGRSEFGPRALGNRSILADPRPAENKTRINSMVKKREGYRPFAPSVREEKLKTFFETPETCAELPFMIFVVPVNPEYRPQLAAITHVDGTARVHSVSRETNPIYWRLIHEFERLTGVGMVLNTSFNNNAEPIVDSVEDAVVAFLTTGLSCLAIGPYIVERRPEPERWPAVRGLAPDLPLWRKLVKRQRSDGRDRARTAVYQIESIKSKEFGASVTEISRPAFDVLQRADGATTLGELLDQTPRLKNAQASAVVGELIELWSQRLVALRPRAQASDARCAEVA